MRDMQVKHVHKFPWYCTPSSQNFDGDLIRISKLGKFSDRVLGPFGEAVAPIEAPAKPVSDGPVPRVRSLNTIGSIDVGK